MFVQDFGRMPLLDPPFSSWQHAFVFQPISSHRIIFQSHAAALPASSPSPSEPPSHLRRLLVFHRHWTHPRP
jgi:hypothetical protein